MSKRKGFTFIEISLFLAVTAALFIGIALGMQNSIFQQRFNDSTQSFLEYMRSVYSKVSNPQSPGAGNSNEAIYGKLVVFGQTKDLQNQDINYNESMPIFSYDVVGKADNTNVLGTGSAVALLKQEEVNSIRYTLGTDGRIATKELASPEKFEPRWQAAIEGINGSKYTGVIMVVRHPRSGVINTLVLNRTIEVNQIYYENNVNEIKNLLTQYLNGSGDNFTAQEVNICVNPYGTGNSGVAPRQNIRIATNARNASSVELVDLDSDDNRCS